MSFLARLFTPARPAQAAPASVGPASSQNLSTSINGTRRELLRVVLRDTLGKHGIPAAWITCEMLVASGKGRELGMHMRLIIKHWDPRLLAHGVAFQKSLRARLASFDPMANHWFMGVSWQFALVDDSACPQMPEASIWTVPASSMAAHQAMSADQINIAPVMVPVVASSALLPSTQARSIAPIAVTTTDRMAELNRMFGEGDARHKRYADGPADGSAPNFEATQPMFQSTQPAPL